LPTEIEDEVNIEITEKSIDLSPNKYQRQKKEAVNSNEGREISFVTPVKFFNRPVKKPSLLRKSLKFNPNNSITLIEGPPDPNDE